jgi:hypothetical protein
MPGKPSPDKQCAATSKRSGERCEAWAVRGSHVCYHHGGRSLVGPANPAWRDGRRSKLTSVLTGTDLETFEEVLADSAYIEMREQMAYLKVLFYDAAERAQVGRSNELWDELAIQWGRFSNPGPERAPERSAAALREFGRIVRQGAAAHRAAVESMDIVERMRKMAESERKRTTEEQQTISVARALAFAGSVFALMRQALAEHIGGTQEERLILAAVQAGIAERIRADVDGRRAG